MQQSHYSPTNPRHFTFDFELVTSTENVILGKGLLILTENLFDIEACFHVQVMQRTAFRFSDFMSKKVHSNSR